MDEQFNSKSKKASARYADYWQIAHYASFIRAELCVRVLLGLAVTASYVVQAIELARAIAAALLGAPLSKLAVPGAVIVLCILLRAVLSNVAEGYAKKLGGKIKGVLREQVIDKLFLLGPGYQMDKRAGRFQSLVTDGVEYLEPFFALFLPQLFIALFSVLPMVVYLFTKSVSAGLVVTAAVLLAAAMPHLMMPFYSKANIDYWSDYAVLNASFIDTMQGMNTLKLFNAEAQKGEQLRSLSERFRIKQLVNTRNSLVTTGVISFASAIATSVATVMVAYRSGMTAPVLLVILFLTMECVRPIGELNLAWHSSMMGFSVVGELLEILHEPIKTTEKETAVQAGLDTALPAIDFEHVSFRYTAEREQALQDLSLHIAPGETAAVVGASGAGKSTLVNLLLRFYDADAGSIRVGGVDVRDYDLQYLRSRIAVVFQTTYLFYGTVRENLKMARPDATDDELIAAAKAANAHDFIMALPQGYDTLVGERGSTLSGGQRQRIAIARAILKNAPILVMDEATSSVDAASEASIRETLEQLNGRFTTILIAHRLSTVQHAQNILVLDHGRVVESGTHDELLSRGGAYCALVEAQRGGQSK